jgi:hypothetical protein
MPSLPRIATRVVGVAWLAWLATPLSWSAGRDGFPVSSYPMFSQPRPRVVRVQTVLGVDADGVRHTLTPELIGASARVNVVAMGLRARVQRGEADAQCREVARRIALGPPLDPSLDLVEVEVVTERLDTIAYLADPTVEIPRRVHARCPVPR